MGLKKGDNPHIWYNLNMPTKYVNYLVKRLSKLDKKHATMILAFDNFLASAVVGSKSCGSVVLLVIIACTSPLNNSAKFMA